MCALVGSLVSVRVAQIRLSEANLVLPIYSPNSLYSGSEVVFYSGAYTCLFSLSLGKNVNPTHSSAANAWTQLNWRIQLFASYLQGRIIPCYWIPLRAQLKEIIFVEGVLRMTCGCGGCGGWDGKTPISSSRNWQLSSWLSQTILELYFLEWISYWILTDSPITRDNLAELSATKQEYWLHYTKFSLHISNKNSSLVSVSGLVVCP